MEARKGQLQQQLQTPGLTDESAQAIRQELDSLGNGKKVYDGKSAPKAGAIRFEDNTFPTRAELKRMRKVELIDMARQRGLKVKGTKSQLVDRIDGARPGGET